jgi:hypothetical protein
MERRLPSLRLSLVPFAGAVTAAPNEPKPRNREDEEKEACQTIKVKGVPVKFVKKTGSLSASREQDPKI